MQDIECCVCKRKTKSVRKMLTDRNKSCCAIYIYFLFYMNASDFVTVNRHRDRMTSGQNEKKEISEKLV